MALPYQPLSPAQRVTIAVLAAVAVHIAILPLIAKDALFKFTGPPHRTQISLLPSGANSNSLSAQERAKSQSSSSKATAPKTEEEKKKEEEEKIEQAKINGQIVSIGPPQDERKPIVPTKFLSEYDSRVLKEMRARETSAFYKNALSKEQKEGKKERVEQKPHATADTAPPEGNSSVDGKEGGGHVAQATTSTPTRVRQDKVQMEVAQDGSVRNRNASDAMKGDGRRLAMLDPKQQNSSIEGKGQGAPGGVRGALNGAGQPLKLSLDNPLETLGPIAGGPMPDHLPDVEEGDQTLLNSNSFVYASYMNRLKETVARIWTSDVQSAASSRDPTGQTYLYKNRRTDVTFTLNKTGEIVDAKVGKSSGVEFLDEVAVGAFKKAERIPNPPPGLIGPNGMVTLGFSFILESGRDGPMIKMGPAYLPGSPAARGW